MEVFITHYVLKRLNKKLRIGYVGSVGRNFSGKICVRHRGGGKKRNMYLVDFFRRTNSVGLLQRIIKTSFYSAFIGLVVYENGLVNYVLLSEIQGVGKRFYSGTAFNRNYLWSYGTTLPVKYVSVFQTIHNVELSPYSGSSLLRAAGACGMITGKSLEKIRIKLRSGWYLTLSKNCLASFGIGSNSVHLSTRKKKAGIMRGLGIRPTVRGVAMNPCDHPHGGGEGKKSGSVAARSIWGWLTKKTPSKKKILFLRKKKLYKTYKTARL